MTTKLSVLSLGIVLLLAVLLFAGADDKRVATEITEIQQSVVAPSSMAACTMVKHVNSPQYINTAIETGWQCVTYYDPEVECSSPTYPFEITAFSFTLYDFNAGVVIWPAMVDVVVYDMAVPGDSCGGPGVELCRFPVVADQTTFEYPAVGTVGFPTPCCVEGPVYVGIEYTAGTFEMTPSFVMDDYVALVVADCDSWAMNIDGTWRDWQSFWTAPAPGYPLFWVDGETVSTNCGDPCTWNPGDPHKMHFPQLPDPMGWDVNATAPRILADDWQCSETGWVKDFHFWGAWKNAVEGEITSFNVSIYSDIVADPPLVPYSRPGDLLWSMEVTEFEAEWFDAAELEGWYDPETIEILWDNNAGYFQYNVCIPEGEWFWQDEQTIYWLAITANVVDPVTTEWGWKSTMEQFNDDAVYYGETVLGCIAPDNGTGTINLPPPCPYTAPEEYMMIIDGLPPGTTIEIDPTLDNYTNMNEVPGGSLGGTIVTFDADLTMVMSGTGSLAGFNRTIFMPVTCEWHTGPRNPGDPVQTFATDFFYMSGTMVGDPDFDVLTITAGTGYGLPSPGSMTLTDLGGGLYHIDSFFDITYQIDFVGAPGSAIEGMAGSTVGTVRMSVPAGSGTPWNELYEPDPPDPRTNAFGIAIDPGGVFMGGMGTDYFEDGTSWDGWYFYPTSEWWNIWFYDHPFDFDRKKEAYIWFEVRPVDPGLPMFMELAVNYSTAWWSLVGDGGDSIPPLPGMPFEDSAIGRVTLIVIEDPSQAGFYEFPWVWTEYNPEWVSIDVRGFNFDIGILGGNPGEITHDCIGPGDQSMDLAFVITGEPPVIDSGACCYPEPTGGTAYLCMVTTENFCVNDLGGVYQGNDTECIGMEACCLPTGDCVMADVLCCTDLLGGVPQGQGSTCTAPEACCLPGGECRDLDPLCCLDLGGAPQGPGTECTTPRACCLNSGDCVMADSICCINELGGVPGQAGEVCTALEACCYTDGSCQDLDPVCCDQAGGTPMGTGTTCATVTCGTVGACCPGDGSCVVLSEEDCLALGELAVYRGDGTTCLGDTSPANGYDDQCECCGLYTGGITGNCNCSPDGKLTLSDISRLIDRVYISKLPLCCEASGNTNASADCLITLSDITKLIDAVYISKTPPAACMPSCY